MDCIQFKAAEGSQQQANSSDEARSQAACSRFAHTAK